MKLIDDINFLESFITRMIEKERSNENNEGIRWFSGQGNRTGKSMQELEASRTKCMNRNNNIRERFW